VIFFIYTKIDMINKNIGIQDIVELRLFDSVLLFSTFFMNIRSRYRALRAVTPTEDTTPSENASIL